MRKVMSRRSLIDLGLRSAAGVGLLKSVPGSELVLNAASGLLNESRSGRRALVCIYCFGGGDDTALAAPNRLQDSLADLHPLYEQKKLAVIPHVSRPVRMRRISGTPGEVMAQIYSTLRFLPQGFVTLEWAARVADIEPLTGSGAYTFDTGVSLIAPGANNDGDPFENAAVRRTTTSLPPLRTTFPDSTLGRQLEDVSRLIRVAPSLGMDRQVFVVGTSGMSRRAATTIEGHRELAQGMAAFFRATVELGLDTSVTTYTDGEFTEHSYNHGTRIVLGGSVIGGEASHAGGISQDSYAGAMAAWFGVAHSGVRTHFPEFEPSALSVTA